MPYITTASGIEFFYEVEGQGQNLIFIHGWSVDHRIWRQQTKVFSNDYRVFGFDLPGHGQSGWGQTSLEQMARDVKEILDVCNINKWTVIGSSMGGLLGLKLYELFPDSFAKLILVGSMPKFSKSEDYPYGIDVARIKNLGDQLARAYPSIVNIFFRSLFTKEERNTRRFRWLQKFREYTDIPLKPALELYLHILETEDLRNVLEQVKVPVKFINGNGDPICTPATVDYLKREMPQAEFFDFDKCGHFPFLSQPHEFNDVLREYLEN